jgi:hypothetical protein
VANQNGCSFYHYPIPGDALNVQSTAPTEVTSRDKSGERRLASKRTQYEIKTTTSGIEWLTYEGEVAVVTGVRPMPLKEETLKQGEKLIAEGSDMIRQKITAEDLFETATIYATVDVSRANVSNPGTVLPVLQKLHQDLLADPTSRVKQINLVNKQKELGIPAKDIASNSIRLSPLDQRFSSKGRWKYNIVDLFSRLDDRSDSKDYYQLAVALDRSKSLDASNAAELALSLNQTDKRLSRTEESNLKRLSNSLNIQNFTVETTQSSDIESLILMPNQKVAHSVKRSSSCKDSHTIRVTLPKSPFVRLLSDPQMQISPGNWEMRLMFDTTGMKPGIYQFDVLFSCLDCIDNKECDVWLPPTQINVLVK